MKFLVTERCFGFQNRLWEQGEIFECQSKPKNLPSQFERVDSPKQAPTPAPDEDEDDGGVPVAPK